MKNFNHGDREELGRREELGVRSGRSEAWKSKCGDPDSAVFSS
jgi:hypothetical protein